MLSRAASHLMDVLLKLEIVPFTAVSDTIQSMLVSIEMTGPSILTESSSSLLTTIVRERMKENPTHFNQTAERIVSWVFSKWTPSKRYTFRVGLQADVERPVVRANLRCRQRVTLQCSRRSEAAVRLLGYTLQPPRPITVPGLGTHLSGKSSKGSLSYTCPVSASAQRRCSIPRETTQAI